MFEVGKRYEIVFIEGGDETKMWGEVERYEHPLLKIADTVFEKGHTFMRAGGTVRGPIFNVTSPLFARAQLDEK